jgi:hypothetical protein
MAQRKKMNAQEMEEWLLSQGAIPVTDEMKKEPWYEEVSRLPSCMVKEVKSPPAGAQSTRTRSGREREAQ